MSYKTCGLVWGHLQAESQTDGQALACKAEDKNELISLFYHTYTKQPPHLPTHPGINCYENSDFFSLYH